MKKKIFFLITLALLLAIAACNLPAGDAGEVPDDEAPAEEAASLPPPENEHILIEDEPDEHELEPGEDTIIDEEVESDDGPTAPEPTFGPPPSGVILPEELVYMGAFRLPEGSGGSDWDYSGHALTFYPGGDPDGPDDGFPGSLYGAGHDQNVQVSEISIPVPVNSKNLDDLNTATTLQPFADISDGIIDPETLDLPRLGLAYLPPMGDQVSGKIHFVYGQHFQDFEPSHGWAELDLSNPQSAGLWVFDGITNYASSDYLFEIPGVWAATYAPGFRLATGRFREGVWGGRGPALFAYAPWEDGNPPTQNHLLYTIKPLLLYGIQEPGLPDIVSDESMQMNRYQLADHWQGGSWLSAGDRSAVIFVGTKAIGASWYGFANGDLWDYACAEQDPPTCPEPPEWPYDDRGYWAEDYQAQIIFFDPADLGKVAMGQMETYEPQPYGVLNLNPYLLETELDPAEYKRDLVFAAAYDPGGRFLYIFERLADEYKSVIHVWQVGQ